MNQTAGKICDGQEFVKTQDLKHIDQLSAANTLNEIVQKQATMFTNNQQFVRKQQREAARGKAKASEFTEVLIKKVGTSNQYHQNVTLEIVSVQDWIRLLIIKRLTR